MSAASMPRSLHVPPTLESDAPDGSISGFREAIAYRAQDHHEAFPRATDLEARCLQAASLVLHGVATYLRGVRSAQGFRAMLAGERHLHLSDLCRLATEPGREAKAAVLVILTEIAAACGYRLEPMTGSAADAHVAVAGLVSSHADFTSEVMTALSDGVLSASEVASLRPKLETAKRSLAQCEGMLAGSGK